jgi:hypothetical protein
LNDLESGLFKTKDSWSCVIAFSVFVVGLCLIAVIAAIENILGE